MASLYTDYKRARSQLRNKLLMPTQRLLAKFPQQKYRLLKFLSAAICIAFSLYEGFFIVLDILEAPSRVGKVIGLNTESPAATTTPVETENPIQKRLEDEKVGDKCSGAIFNPILDLMPVGNERFKFIDKENQIVSAEGTDGYQATVKTSWYCKMPFTATLRLYPRSGQSLGVFIEFENVFLALLGDGDKKTFVIQQNKRGLRDYWDSVLEMKLKRPIEDNEEVILVVRAKVSDGWLVVAGEIRYSKNGYVESFNARFKPNGANITEDQPRRFRVGIKDAFYKGQGSVVQFDTFSVEEGNWN